MILSDREIRERSIRYGMIEPFEPGQVRELLVNPQFYEHGGIVAERLPVAYAAYKEHWGDGIGMII